MVDEYSWNIDYWMFFSVSDTMRDIGCLFVCLVKVKEECESAAIGCVDCKVRLAKLINEFFRPIREKRNALAKNPDEVIKILDYGNAKARKVIGQTLADVYEIMGLRHWKK